MVSVRYTVEKLSQIKKKTQTFFDRLKYYQKPITIVPQLDKCLKFMAFRGVILYRVQLFLCPQKDLNFGHLSSCDTIKALILLMGLIPTFFGRPTQQQLFSYSLVARVRFLLFPRTRYCGASECQKSLSEK